MEQRVRSLLQLDGELTRERYVEVLQGFAAFLVPWERQLAATLPAAWRPFFDARRRVGEADALGDGVLEAVEGVFGVSVAIDPRSRSEVS